MRTTSNLLKRGEAMAVLMEIDCGDSGVGDGGRLV